MRLTPLVGRDGDLGEVMRALASSRLLTLTGPGGVGKTRLALAAAVRLTAEDTDVAWADLAPVADPQAIAPMVAARLGVPEAAGTDPVAAITAHLAAARAGNAKPVVVVLDSCEHVAAETGSFTERLLAECPSLSVLATSREPLGVEGERSWPVPPLERAHAARLFEDRARLVAPSFSITDGNRQTVTQVCTRLDGLPLAIELAAARMRVLSVRQLAQRLDDMFGVLVGGARSAPPRHQALRATLDWSYDLLTSEERTVFRRLATFADGFSLTAAERVVAFGDIGPGQVLDLLARLADKSLIRVEGERYHLLATTREYAAAKLDQAGERDQTRREHLKYCSELAERPQHERSVAAARAVLGEADYEAARRRGAAASDPDEYERKLRTPPPVSAAASAGRPPEPADPERVSGDPVPGLPPPGLITSALTGATPILTDLPPTWLITSALTGATPILAAATQAPSPSQVTTGHSAGAAPSPPPPVVPPSPASSVAAAGSAAPVRDARLEPAEQSDAKEPAPLVGEPAAGSSVGPGSGGVGVGSA
jgi:predicted ATPase